MSMMEVGGTLSSISNAYTAATILFDVLSANYVGAAEEIAQQLICAKFGRVLCEKLTSKIKQSLSLFCHHLRCKSIIPKLDLGSASGAGLAKNLELLGIPRPKGSQAHHIVGAVSPKGKMARSHLAALGIPVNSPAKGVFLPGCKGSKAIGMVHCGKHTADYEEAVWDRIQGLDREAVLNELDIIRRELPSGNFLPLNMRSL